MRETKLLDRQFFPAGTTIIKEGDEAYKAYVIQTGEVSVYSKQDGKKIVFSTLKTGDIFGEMALIKDKTRSATVEAVSDTTVITIHRDDFKAKLRKADPTIRAVVDMLSQRILRANSEVLKTKGVNLDNFVMLLNQIFKDLLDIMPEDDKAAFKADSFPVLHEMLEVLEKYRDKF